MILMKRVVVFWLLLLTLYSCQGIDFENIERIEVVSLPFDLTTRTPIDTESEFDEAIQEWKDTCVFEPADFRIALGDELSGFDHIDIRAKVLLKDNKGRAGKFFISSTGLSLYDGKIYSGSKYTELLMRKIDSARSLKKTPGQEMIDAIREAESN